MVRIENQALDEVAPFSLVVAGDGTLLHVGRSIRKTLSLDPADPPVGFFELFRITSPRRLRDTKDLAAACGKRLSLEATRKDQTDPVTLRASIAATGSAQDAFIILMSLGADLPKLVDELGLSNQDFAHADPSTDLLYLLKTQTALLQDANDLAERLKAAKEKAEALALSDPLTGLPNRRALETYTKTRLFHGLSKGQRAHLLHIDLDRFKQVNDRLGHAAGDAILVRVTDDLRAACGPDGFVARIGGDEFVLILKTPSTMDDVRRLAADLIATISTPLEIGKQQAMVGASIGVTVIDPEAPKNIDTYLLEADLALYDVKNAGRGAVKVFSGELQDREELTQELIRDIEPAIQRGEFVPYYQVQFDTRTGSVFGAEVLGRWNHPRHGLIPPSRFLYVAERAKLTEKIDTAIYRSALDDFAAWKAEGIAPPHISLNLTERFLFQSRFISWFVSELQSRGLEPGEITFELVETILMDGECGAICQHAEQLAKLGFGLAIDDFGTGRASVTSLISIPVTLVKIDRAFISGIHKDERRALLAAAIIKIANQLGLETLAEGSELKEECRVVQDLGCHVFQGFLFGTPIPGVEFAEKLRDQNWITTEALFGETDEARDESRAAG